MRSDTRSLVEYTRLSLFYVIIALCFSMLAAGLGYRQLIQKEEFTAAEQRQNYRRILLPGPRGNIFDRHGKLLVGNRPLFSAVVYLNELRPEFRREYYRLVRDQRDRGLNPDRYEMNITARRNVVQYYMNRICTILGKNVQVNSREIERHFSQSLLLPFPLMQDLEPEDYARLIEQIRIDSPIQIFSDTARYYPHHKAAAHTLGFVSESKEFPEEDVPGSSLLTFRFAGKIGRSGLEYSFNDRLQGKAGGEIWTVDPSGFQYERVLQEQPQKGEDLVTSLDINIQKAAEEALGTKIGAVVAIEVKTGEVLTLASKPNFDLNDLSPFIPFSIDQEIRESGGWLNRATQGLYPPGSTFKIITALAGLKNGTIDAETEINCPGYYAVGRRIFHCHRRSGHGDENLIGAIRDSCNVFFYDRSREIGIENMAEMARIFGLDSPTGIELPGETRRMLIPDPAWKKRRFFGESWFDGDTVNVSIGQGFLLVTPLQMAAFVAALSNGVDLIQPTLLHGEEREASNPIQLKSLLPDGSLALVREGMKEAGRTGTARLAGNPQMPVAGKTGTAQVRKDGKPTTLAWFVGYSPVDNPTIAVAVLVEGVPAQETQYGGGSTAAPIAKAVFQTYFEGE